MNSSSLRASVIYLLLLLVLSSFLHFYRLEERSFYGDEAIYATVRSNMEQRGDLLNMRFIEPDTPYLEKPPLFFWFAMTAHRFIDNEELAQRFWPALFGIGSVLLTFVLGRLLFSAATGFFAALLLTTNSYFLLQHGSRHGTMDSAITFAGLIALLLVWKIPSMKRPLLGWLGVGLATGFVSFMKAMPPGLLLLVLVTCFACFYPERIRVADRVKGFLTGLLGIALVAGPYFSYQWLTYGSLAEERHLSRFLGDLHPEHVEGPFYFLKTITDSGSFFVLFLPALLLTVFFSIKGGKRRAYGLISVVTIGYLLALSSMGNKRMWYAYPVYPLIALGISALTFYPLQFFNHTLLRQGLRPLFGAALCLAAAAVPVSMGGDLIKEDLPNDVGERRDLRWELYRLLPEQTALVVLQHPDSELNAFRDYYLNHKMQGVEVLQDLKTALQRIRIPGSLVVTVESSVPDEWGEALDQAFNQAQGYRLQTLYHRAYVREWQPVLPESLRCSRSPLRPVQPPLNRLILFNCEGVENFLGSGWSTPEHDGLWSDGAMASLRMALNTTGSLDVTLGFKTYRSQAFRIEFNGQPLVSVQGTGDWQEETFQLPMECFAPENQLVFRLPEARSPAECQGVDDSRLLGIFLRSICIAERISAPAP